MRAAVAALAALLLAGCVTAEAQDEIVLPDQATIDAEVRRVMAATGAKGLALAVVDDGVVRSATAYGLRDAGGAPLQTTSILYGASLTKAAFAYMVMQLVEEGRLGLDTPIDRLLPKSLPEYEAANGRPDYRALAGDERWRKLTPRLLLAHGSGFANFAFLEPDERLRFHFEPGARYAYSGEGYVLLQFVLEEGLGLDVGAEMRRRVFDWFGMSDSSMTWRADFAGREADGWNAQGGVEPHDERGRVRAAGSMDTTIADIARFAAAYVRGEGLSPKNRAELVRVVLPITTAHQFPTLLPEAPPERRVPKLGSALGVVVFEGRQGRGFYKGGHNDTTGATWVCIERRRRCVVILANDVRAEAAFPGLVRLVLGETGAPWSWEYSPLPPEP